MNIGWVWVKNAEGKADTMLSFSVVAFVVIIFKVLFGGTKWVVGAQAFDVIPIDPGMVGALLVPTLSAYVARRYTDKKFDTDGDGVPDSDVPKP